MSFCQLPPEILLHIGSFAVGSATADHATSGGNNSLMAAVSTQQALGLVNRKMQRVMDDHNSKVFHAFHPNFQPNLRAFVTMWLPEASSLDDAQRRYLKFHGGSNWTPLVGSNFQSIAIDNLSATRLQSVSIDSRVPGFSSSNNPHVFGLRFFNRWFASAALLARVAVPNLNLRSAHLRMPAQAEAFLFLEAIMAHNNQLRHLVIEADAAFHSSKMPRPQLRLSKLSADCCTYATMDTFVFRAPIAKVVADDSLQFFERLKTVRKFCIAAHTFSTSVPVWHWILRLLHSLPNAEQIDFSLLDHVAEDFHPDAKFDVAHLPNLTDLTLSIHQVDARLLTKINAPNLRAIRIRTSTPIDGYGFCSLEHFPSLLYVTIQAPGTISGNCNTLGIQPHNYVHNISKHQLDLDYGEEMVAYIKPYDRRTRKATPLLKRSDFLSATSPPPSKRTRLHE
ncbi:hypothetical protein A4X13_0g6490 [Tilletia indica]|uniref:Uncharacterized protein n=1 Tax=Tilletia indica TaxID=43049 RepID=A0A177TLW0_9BASI|nr:hypothetical protein A4X13_0g6490 [Tilletia indica]